MTAEKNCDLISALGEFNKSLLITLETTRRLMKEVTKDSVPCTVKLPPQLTGKVQYLKEPSHALYIYLPGPIPSLNMDLQQYMNMDRRVKASLRDWWYSRLETTLEQAKLKPHFNGPVVILLKSYGRLDIDNYGIKYIVDSLRYLNVIVDDDAANLSGMILLTEDVAMKEESHLEIMLIQADSMIPHLQDIWAKHRKYFQGNYGKQEQLEGKSMPKTVFYCSD